MYGDGESSKERLSDMVRRILRSMYAVGIDKWGPAPQVDMAKDNEVALETAREGIVLLKNEGVLPLAADTTVRIVVIGGHAEERVHALGRVRSDSSRQRAGQVRPADILRRTSQPWVPGCVLGQ